jgi:hypothetical protein
LGKQLGNPSQTALALAIAVSLAADLADDLAGRAARLSRGPTGPDEHRNGDRHEYYFVVLAADGVGQNP